MLVLYGVVVIFLEVFGYFLFLFICSVFGVIFIGVFLYLLWEYFLVIGCIFFYGSDFGVFLLVECFGCKSVILVKDVNGFYKENFKNNENVEFICEIFIEEVREGNFVILLFEWVLLDLFDYFW